MTPAPGAPASFAERLRQARARGAPGALVEAVPYARRLGVGLRLEPAAGGALVASLAPSPALIGNPAIPALHGGVVGALLELVAQLELAWADDDAAALPAAVSLTIEYLRPAAVAATHARARVVRRGRRFASVRAEAWQLDPDAPVAAAHATLRRAPAPGPA